LGFTGQETWSCFGSNEHWKHGDIRAKVYQQWN
jgi:hypothetical protein